MDGKKKISDYLKGPLIFVDADFKTQNEVFEAINKEALKQKFVTPTFLSKLTEREQTFPTGIPLEKIGAAIPHTDAECVSEEFIAIVTVKKPVDFKSMEDGVTIVPARIIFVLALNQPHAQLEMLQSLMGVLQNEKLLEKLLEASDKTTFFNTMIENNL
ncbi:MAG: PTS sugar transporter subunit IIA [Bavariicoccus seileri]|uniref:PTS fructose transporter subunit IIA n=1 Tax=Bavariicoccus seileri TaxID=549685 RepID=A0A3D4S4K4_9ENTE|nr:PTS sugar transporter subunit IIA [Bavariicoccus seileri]HCS93737.1 PTS fructose transporter subunit IIA [Bavariicoccus seileri]